MALTQALLSRGRCAGSRTALVWAASRAHPCRAFGDVPASAILRSKKGSPKYAAKLEDYENQWAARAERIKKGEEKNIWDVFEERGFVKDVAGNRDTIRELLRTRSIGAYVGIDPTASSMHVGHLVPLMPLFWMYMYGYKTFSLIGGSTARIGDPTGRLQARNQLARSGYVMNMTKIHAQLKVLWANVESQARDRGYEKQWGWRRGIVNNNAWWNKQPFQEIMKRVGMHMRLGPMLSRDNVKQRLKPDGDGISFAEFTYPLMQGWDWFELARQLDVQMQIGGSDQFGNILTGIEVFRAARDSDKDPATKLPCTSELDEPVGFTVPLLTDSKGNKFGKSADNAVWLDMFQTPVYDFYGYFMRRPDADLEQLFKLLTFLPLHQIQQVLAEHSMDPTKRVGQHKLAREVTALVHGRERAAEAEDEHRRHHRKPMPLGGEQYQAVEGRPTTTLNRPRIDMILPRSLILGKSIGRILYAAGLAKSATEGHRLQASEGAYIGGAPGQKRAMDPSALAFTPIKTWFVEETQRYLIDDEYLILRRGKHNIRVIKVVSDEEYKESGETYPGQAYTGAVRKMREHLKELKDKNKTSEEIRQLLREDEAKSNPDTEQVLVFPPDKGRQLREMEAKLADELNKSKESTETEGEDEQSK